MAHSAARIVCEIFGRLFITNVTRIKYIFGSGMHNISDLP